MNEFNENKELEVMDFRRQCFTVCKEAVDQRDANEQSQVLYIYPADIHSSQELPLHIQNKVHKGKAYSVFI